MTVTNVCEFSAELGYIIHILFVRLSDINIINDERSLYRKISNMYVARVISRVQGCIKYATPFTVTHAEAREFQRAQSK